MKKYNYDHQETLEKMPTETQNTHPRKATDEKSDKGRNRIQQRRRSEETFEIDRKQKAREYLAKI